MSTEQVKTVGPAVIFTTQNNCEMCHATITKDEDCNYLCSSCGIVIMISPTKSTKGEDAHELIVKKLDAVLNRFNTIKGGKGE